MENQIDFLAIGDIVIDAFIRLKDAEVHCELNNTDCKLCLRYGDKVPYESVEEVCAVGNSGNAAVSAARLGVKSTIIAHVGNDKNGENCISSLKKDGVNTEFVFKHDGIATNYHYVLWYDVDRTILVKHQEFPYQLPQNMTVPKMIYLSSLGANSKEYHHEIAAYIAAHPECKLVFQPGTFQIKLGTTELADIYKNTYAFFCNKEEAQIIVEDSTQDIKTLIAKLHALGPKIVIITDGMAGAYASDGSNAWFMPVYPHEPYDRTGAGDAFASTVSVALLMGKNLSESLTWGPINSMSVVQYVGAQKGLLSKEKIEEYLLNAPADYKLQPLV